jgi:hypothetical protein
VKRTIVGTFEREQDLVAATKASRERGLFVQDAFAPYAVHGLEVAMGLRRSRLPVACFLCGLAGIVLALWFQFWTSAWDWPLNVGGRPWNSLPAFVPVAFEMMVLLGGLGLVFAWLVVCRLFPGKTAVEPVAQVTDNRFAVVVEERDQPFDPKTIEQLFRDCNAINVEVRDEMGAR